MVCPTKHQRQAKHQRTQASGRKVFDTGITEDLLEVTLDSTYQLQSDNNSASDSDTFSGKGMGRMAFSLMDKSDIELDPTGIHDSDSDGDSPSPGSGTDVIFTDIRKRQRTEDINPPANDSETDDYIEQSACQAAATAHTFWTNITHSVCNILSFIVVY
jgi:hypothetical protein